MFKFTIDSQWDQDSFMHQSMDSKSFPLVKFSNSLPWPLQRLLLLIFHSRDNERLGVFPISVKMWTEIWGNLTPKRTPGKRVDVRLSRQIVEGHKTFIVIHEHSHLLRFHCQREADGWNCQGCVLFIFIMYSNPVTVIRGQREVPLAVCVASCHTQVPPRLAGDLHLPVGPPRRQPVEPQDTAEHVKPPWSGRNFLVLVSIFNCLPIRRNNKVTVCSGRVQLYIHCSWTENKQNNGKQNRGTQHIQTLRCRQKSSKLSKVVVLRKHFYFGLWCLTLKVQYVVTDNLLKLYSEQIGGSISPAYHCYQLC